MHEHRQYWVMRQGKTSGPFEGQQLVSMARSELIGQDDMISTDGFSWHKAGKVKGLFGSDTPLAEPNEPSPLPVLLPVEQQVITDPSSCSVSDGSQDAVPGNGGIDADGRVGLGQYVCSDVPPEAPDSAAGPLPAPSPSAGGGRRFSCTQCGTPFWATRQRFVGKKTTDSSYQVTFLGFFVAQCPHCQSSRTYPCGTFVTVFYFCWLAFICVSLAVIRLGAWQHAVSIWTYGLMALLSYAVVKNLYLRHKVAAMKTSPDPSLPPQKAGAVAFSQTAATPATPSAPMRSAPSTPQQSLAATGHVQPIAGVPRGRGKKVIIGGIILVIAVAALFLIHRQKTTDTPEAMYGRGIACAQAKDYAEAVKWFHKAAEENSREAMHALGLCYSEGRGVPQNYAEAVAWCHKAADAGVPGAMSDMGAYYEHGYGVPQNYGEAVKWYHKAAEAGDPLALHNLGVCYAEGHGVSQDYAEAVTWYRKAAKADVLLGMVNLGGCYATGQGVPQDYAEAVTWFRKAAEAGSPEGMYDLGLYYAKGYGVPQDNAEGLRWLRKAAAAGSEEAKKLLKELEGN